MMQIENLRVFISRLFVGLFLVALYGCGGAVKYTLAPGYHEKMPHSIAVLPVGGDRGNADARYLFRVMVQEKLMQMRHSPIPLEAIDDRILRSGMRRDEFQKRSPKDLASIVGADAVLYITITEWDATLFLNYASLKIGAKLELYDGVTGERLWEGESATKDSDMSLERSVIELGIIKAYEPAIQRVVDAVFSTIPGSTIVTRGNQKKAYYDWLP